MYRREFLCSAVCIMATVTLDYANCVFILFSINRSNALWIFGCPYHLVEAKKKYFRKGQNLSISSMFLRRVYLVQHLPPPWCSITMELVSCAEIRCCPGVRSLVKKALNLESEVLSLNSLSTTSQLVIFSCSLYHFPLAVIFPAVLWDNPEVIDEETQDWKGLEAKQ
jgi:hypothetical protein